MAEEQQRAQVHAVGTGAGGVVAGGLSGKKEKLLHADVDLHQVRAVVVAVACW